MSASWRVAIPIIASEGWLGGVSYIENLIKGLCALPSAHRPQCYLLVNDQTLNDYELHSAAARQCRGVLFLGSKKEQAKALIKLPLFFFPSVVDLLSWVDFIFPLNSGPLNGVFPLDRELCSNPKLGHWIPDFQHVYLPQLFTPDDRAARDKAFGMLAESAPLIVFSSAAADKCFHELYPASQTKSLILQFFSVMEDQLFSIDPRIIQAKYELPDNYLICCNQFWMHKNHLTLLRACSILKSNGLNPRLVCTGTTTDYRVTDYFTHLKQCVAELGLIDNVKILGFVPRQEQLQLIRRAAAVVQPSLFEGWSTVVEDARALGKKIFLSDLPVHFEQNPADAVFFERIDPVALAELLKANWPSLKPGPDSVQEQRAQAEKAIYQERYTTQFLNLLKMSLQLQQIKNSPTKGSSSPDRLRSGLG